MRSIPCTEFLSGHISAHDSVWAVYGPLSQREAEERAERFNNMTDIDEEQSELVLNVGNVPVVLKKKLTDDLSEYYAVAHKMNDVEY